MFVCLFVCLFVVVVVAVVLVVVVVVVVLDVVVVVAVVAVGCCWRSTAIAMCCDLEHYRVQLTNHQSTGNCYCCR